LRPERWLWAIHRYRATLSAAPNFALELCVYRVPDSAIQGLDLSRWRLAFCGAEPIFEETLDHFSQRFAPFGFRRDALFPVYGLAENTLGLTFPPTGRAPRILRIAREPFLQRGAAQPAQGAGTLSFVSCGQPLREHEIRIVDEAGRELPDGMQGSVQFRGPSATSGYFRAAETTQHLFHDSWLDSGDLGFVFEGELYLTGRVKDLIIRAGRHIHPQAIEQAIGSVAGIRRGRVAVFGSYSRDEGTERLVVVAETRITDAEALGALRKQVNAIAADLSGGPADEVILAPPGSVLKTSSGKLRRSACQAAHEAGTLGKGRKRALLAVLLRGLSENVRGRLRRAGALAFAAYAWAILALLFVPAVIALAVLPGVPARWRATRTIIGVLRAALRLPLTLHVEQAPPERPCIFVANHSSYIDALILLWALPRPVAFTAKAELSRKPLFHWLLSRLGAVFVERADPQRSTEVVGQAREGRRDFLFFPEGTFSRMPGLLPFHLGAFLAAAHAGLPVVPVALRGTRAVLRDVEQFPRRAPVDVTIGAPIMPQPVTDHWHEALRLSEAARRFLLDHGGEPDAADRPLPVSPSP
jgi:1-acyl-sn-glycerol-3-phosphate acyltransferase